MQALEYWTTKLITLKQGGTKSGKAPHKPVLLLSLIDLIEDLNVSENRLPINERLFEKFKSNWKLLITSENKCDITLPIFHLQNEKFWKVANKDNSSLEKKPSSENQILKNVGFGSFDQNLWQFISDETYRPLLRMVLLDFYFPDSKSNYLNENKVPGYIAEIEEMIFEDMQAEYKIINRSEEGFVRNWKFRDAIMQAYDFTCCISSLNFDPPLPIIEACHIKPFADFGNNHISNGIPLCTNLHRAFDAGILSLKNDYTVIVKGKRDFKESGNSPYNLRQFVGNKILLPTNEKFFPSLECLQWHREYHGFKI